MQFTAIITAALVATAVAVPTGTSYTPETPSTPTTGNCNGGQGTIVCCQSGGLLGALTCVLGLCNVGSNGGSAFCCNNVQNGIINLNLLQCTDIL